MLKPLPVFFLFIILFPVNSRGQDSDPGPGYQMMMINNPSLAGSEGDGTLRLSYLNYFPGNSFNLHSVYFSYDSYFPVLHGGAGIYITDDYQGGIINDIRGGLSYAYFLQAGKDLFINAGLTASFYSRGFNFSNAVLPDQIDVLGGVSPSSSEALAFRGRTVFDVGAGFLFMTGKFSGGFSINHLAQPDLSSTGESDILKRKFLFHLSADFDLNKELYLKVKPLTFFETAEDYFIGGAGAALETRNLSINTLFLSETGNALDVQCGFAFYTGRISVYYNYRLNLISQNKSMPLSLLHQTGLAFTLNNVEKRNTIKTINFPKL
jgi:type IX secretion system PorP/SprF family membrane protein